MEKAMTILSRRQNSRLPALALALLGLWALLGNPRLAWAQIKLYLKDGSYQLVKSYEVRGDRVRYYSLERSAWEEVPKSLVDFVATKKAQEEAEASKKKDLEEVRELEKQRFERPEETGFEVAPGIRLPKDEGVFAFDGVRLIPMVQSSAELVTDKKRTALLLALPVPLVKNRSLVVLPGPKAAVRISAVQPTFFVQSADGWGAKAELIPLKAGKDSRMVEKVQSGMGAGKSGELRTSVPLERAGVAPGLFKLRPTQALAPGEYALGELLQEKLNLELWDFGIEGTSKAGKTSKPARPSAPTQH
jgi:hypothetical protein